MNELTRPHSDGGPDPESIIQSVALVIRMRRQIASLSGYRRSFSVPTECNNTTQAFVERLGQTEIRSDLDSVFTSLRSLFKFRRTQLTTEDFSTAGGTIRCPYFTYTSFIEQDPAAPETAVWHRTVSEIVEPAQLLSAGFMQAFHNIFDTVELVPDSPIDLEKLIDHIEARDNDRVRLDYDRQITYCAVTTLDSDVGILVTPGALQIVHPQPTSTRTLLQSLMDVQTALVDLSSL